MARGFSFEKCSSLKEMVDQFLVERSGHTLKEKRWWGDTSLSPLDACQRAMFGLGSEDKRDGHQWTYRAKDLRAMGQQLASGWAQLSEAEDFPELYLAVERALSLKHNRKPLLVYDVAQRLAYRRGFEPEEVYLHAGPRRGATALKHGLGRPRHRPLSDFPSSIRSRLTPAQAEDFLCIASKNLHAGLWD